MVLKTYIFFSHQTFAHFFSIAKIKGEMAQLLTNICLHFE